MIFYEDSMRNSQVFKEIWVYFNESEREAYSEKIQKIAHCMDMQQQLWLLFFATTSYSMK